MSPELFQSRLAAILSLPDRAAAYYDLVDLMYAASGEQRAQLRNAWDFAVKWTYPDPHRLACRVGQPRSPRERARASLAYQALNDLRGEDDRDVLVGLAIEYHGCLFAGLDPIEMFEDAARICTPSTAAFIRSFAARNESDKSMRAFGLVAESDRDGNTKIYSSS
jgi:hypothetical protein